ncbi:hypothetical protein GCM10010909_02960 [Acidocella aquatica]|uniref:Lipoprotein n=2 Tax=Acidocella aquatica TaxID=1922313 RepID=A0ABQ6A1Y3_9PROT|nr:hypothetical protein GCM10010909_02960 [Acidocella aquatica]
MSICRGYPGLRAALLPVAMAAVLSGCSLPPGQQAQMNTPSSVPSSAALQQAELQGYNRGFAAGELAQALRDKVRQPALAIKQTPPAPPLPAVAPQPVIPAAPQVSSPPGTSYNSSGPAKPLGGSAEPF